MCMYVCMYVYVCRLVLCGRRTGFCCARSFLVGGSVPRSVQGHAGSLFDAAHFGCCFFFFCFSGVFLSLSWFAVVALFFVPYERTILFAVYVYACGSPWAYWLSFLFVFLFFFWHAPVHPSRGRWVVALTAVVRPWTVNRVTGHFPISGLGNFFFLFCFLVCRVFVFVVSRLRYFLCARGLYCFESSPPCPLCCRGIEQFPFYCFISGSLNISEVMSHDERCNGGSKGVRRYVVSSTCRTRR